MIKNTTRYFFIYTFLIFGNSLFAQSPDWFTDVTDQVGLTGERMQKAYSTDVNGDGFQDLIIISGIDYLNNRTPMKLFMNEPSESGSERQFVNRTEGSGINSNVDPSDTGRQTTCAAFADVDNDGDIDMVTAHYFHRLENYKDVGDRCQVMLNDGYGHFKVKKDNGLDKLGLTNTQGLSFLDYDLDGNIDLFIGNWFSDYAKDKVQDDYLMKGRGDGTFVNVTELTNLNKPSNEPLYGCSAGDWNNDHWTDIFSASYCRTGGSLWKNTQKNNFENVAKSVGYTSQLLKGDGGQELCHWAAMPCDYDNDGDYDFFFALVHGGTAANEGRSTIIKNQGPDSNYYLRWAMDLTPKIPPYAGHIATYDANWFDFNNDGLTDLCYADGTYSGAGYGRLYMYLQGSDNKFTDINKPLGLTGTKYQTMSLVRPIDYDNDGDEDLLVWGGGTSTSVHVPIFLKNNSANANNHVVVNLKPALGTNGSCIGARITVHAGSLTKTREIYAGQGNAAGQAPFSLVFGLGKVSKIDSIVVIFPNKSHRQIIKKDLEVNQTYTIHEFIENLADQSMVVYPNPAKNQVKIAYSTDFGRNLNLSVFDLQGKEVLGKSIEAAYSREYLDISALSAGYYIVQLRSDNGKVSRTRLLVE